MIYILSWTSKKVTAFKVEENSRTFRDFRKNLRTVGGKMECKGLFKGFH